MSAPQSTLTYEGIMEMIHGIALRQEETDRIVQESAEAVKESAKQLKATQKELGRFGNRIGEIVENMVRSNIAEKFRVYGYDVADEKCREKEFKNKNLGIDGEIDLFLENGDIAILIEAKTTLETKDVRRHIRRMEEFRLYTDARGVDKRHFIGAVAGAVVEKEAKELAMEKGLFVITQSGEFFEIVPPPEGFTAKKW